MISLTQIWCLWLNSGVSGCTLVCLAVLWCLTELSCLIELWCLWLCPSVSGCTLLSLGVLWYLTELWCSDRTLLSLVVHWCLTELRCSDRTLTSDRTLVSKTLASLFVLWCQTELWVPLFPLFYVVSTVWGHWRLLNSYLGPLNSLPCSMCLLNGGPSHLPRN